MRHPGYKYVLALVDWLCLMGAFWGAIGFQSHARYAAEVSSYPLNASGLFAAVLGAATVVLLKSHDLYKVNIFLTAIEQLARTALALLYAVFVLAIASFFTKSSFIPDSRLVVAAFYVLALASLFGVRYVVFRPLFLLLTKANVYARKALIVGAGRLGRQLAANLHLSNPYGIRILGFLDDSVSTGTMVVLGLSVLGKRSDAPRVVKSKRVSEVFIAPDDGGHADLLDTIEQIRPARVSVKVVSPLYDIIPQKIFTEKYGDISVTGLANLGPNEIQLLGKRMFDIAASALGLAILSPMFLLLAIVIKLDSRGPVFYRQTRIGKDGTPFQFYKFRSMQVGTDRDVTRKTKVAEFIKGRGNGAVDKKIVDDSKVTKIGRLIRRTSIDELPQLFNVLKGEMSLVGPRPCLPYEWEHYEDWHKKRLSITPGCTGIWQVSGRSEVGFDDMVVMDLYYLNNVSLVLDLQLILKTIPVMLLGRGAK